MLSLSARSREPSRARMSVVASCMSTAKYSEPSLTSAPSSISVAARSKRSFTTASASAVTPSPLVALGSAPPLIKVFAAAS